MNNDHSHLTELVRRFESRSARVVIVGDQDSSLDTASAFAAQGFDTTVLSGQRGPRPGGVPGPEEGCRWRGLAHSDDDAVLDTADAVILCPTVALTKTRTPDASHLIEACATLAGRSRRIRLVAVESAASVGTARGLLAPVFERHGAVIGRDLFLAVVPTRVAPPDSGWQLRNTPRVIGGVTDTCLTAVRALYGTIVESVVPVSSVETAEMVKALEIEFRTVNVALVNEFAKTVHSLGLSTREILDAAATKPFGFMAFSPGPGLADTTLGSAASELIWTRRALRPDATLCAAADEVNLSMPRWIVSRIVELLNDDARPASRASILVSGVTYRRDEASVHDSPAIEIANELLRLGARVAYVDPYVPELTIGHVVLRSESIDLGGKGFDLVLILTDHTTLDLSPIVGSTRLIFDLRNATSRVTPPAGVRVVHL